MENPGEIIISEEFLEKHKEDFEFIKILLAIEDALEETKKEG